MVLGVYFLLVAKLLFWEVISDRYFLLLKEAVGLKLLILHSSDRLCGDMLLFLGYGET
jgi:hypothetical protein